MPASFASMQIESNSRLIGNPLRFRMFRNRSTVRMRRKAANYGDYVVVPDEQRAPSVFTVTEWKVVFGLESKQLISEE